jgi:hypothetical protein
MGINIIQKCRKKTQINLPKMEPTTPAKGSNGVEDAAGKSSEKTGNSSSERLNFLDMLPLSISRN